MQGFVPAKGHLILLLLLSLFDFGITVPHLLQCGGGINTWHALNVVRVRLEPKAVWFSVKVLN